MRKAHWPGLKAVRKTFIDPAIAVHRGRIVKTTGDGLLVEFASAVDAVRGAVEIQRRMTEQNAGVPQDARMEFRVGVHVGDIIFDDNDIFGDGVNIAARLEGIAEPGGICISDDTYRHIRGKIDAGFTDFGLEKLKNIPEPMRVWRYAVSAVPSTRENEALSGIMREGPSVAVLPFNNMSNDPDQDYFADGTVEDIITALARYPSLFVVARNSSFCYKGKSPDIRAVGRDLGVRYVLEGSIRQANGRIRVTAQLIEAETAHHLWAEKYDGILNDVFDFQDRIVSSVVGTIGPQIGEAEMSRAMKRPANNLSAYELLLRSKHEFRKMTKSGFENAIALAESALKTDPSLASAAVAAANVRGYWVASGLSSDVDRDIEATFKMISKALELDPFNVEALAFAGRSYACFGDHQAGLEMVDQACRDYPYSAMGWTEAGWANVYCARPKQAIECIHRAQQLSPRDPAEYDRLTVKAILLNQLGEHDQAISTAKQSIRMNSNVPGPYRCLIAALALTGRIEEARHASAGLLALEPTFRISEYDRRMRWDPKAKATTIKGLRVAGLPE
jgi:adenylate cyclase